MARKAAAAAQLDARFLLMDAEALDFQQSFDLLWSVESISHYHVHRSFFASAVRFLKPGGVFALTDWFKRGLGGAAAMHLEGLVGAVANKLRAGRPQGWELGHVRVWRRGGCLVDMDRGHVGSLSLPRLRGF